MRARRRLGLSHVSVSQRSVYVSVSVKIPDEVASNR